jgi:hypothetical protein
VIKEETIGGYVRASEFIIYGDLFISAISDKKIITGKLKIVEMLKGEIGRDEIDVNIDMLSPANYLKLRADLTNLNISASEDIEMAGSSLKKVIVMLNKAGKDGYDFLRIITLFRPDKLETYVYSYKEIVSMTKITDEKKLIETIRYNLQEEFSYSLYNHCFDELFKLKMDFSELFPIVKGFLIYKGERKNHSWFTLFKRAGKRLEKDYGGIKDNAKDDFFDYLLNSYDKEPKASEYTNKRFLELLYDLRRLIIKSEKWKEKFYETLKNKKIIVRGLGEEHFRNKELEQLREKVMRSLSKK